METEDAHRTQTGPVSSLSCRESFQAALSLALALGDVVLSYSAPIHLETHYKCGVPGSIGSGTTSSTPPEFRPVGDANTPRSTSE